MESNFKKAFKAMLEPVENGLSEIDKVIKYTPNIIEKKKAQHDKDVMLSMKERPISIVFIHEMKSIYVAKDLISMMIMKEADTDAER